MKNSSERLACTECSAVWGKKGQTHCWSGVLLLRLSEQGKRETPELKSN